MFVLYHVMPCQDPEMMIRATPGDYDSDETGGASDYSFATSDVMTSANTTTCVMTCASATPSCAGSVCQDVDMDGTEVINKILICYL